MRARPSNAPQTPPMIAPVWLCETGVDTADARVPEELVGAVQEGLASVVELREALDELAGKRERATELLDSRALEERRRVDERSALEMFAGLDDALLAIDVEERSIEDGEPTESVEADGDVLVDESVAPSSVFELATVEGERAVVVDASPAAESALCAAAEFASALTSGGRTMIRFALSFIVLTATKKRRRGKDTLALVVVEAHIGRSGVHFAGEISS